MMAHDDSRKFTYDSASSTIAEIARQEATKFEQHRKDPVALEALLGAHGLAGLMESLEDLEDQDDDEDIEDVDACIVQHEDMDTARIDPFETRPVALDHLLHEDRRETMISSPSTSSIAPHPLRPRSSRDASMETEKFERDHGLDLRARLCQHAERHRITLDRLTLWYEVMVGEEEERGGMPEVLEDIPPHLSEERWLALRGVSSTMFRDTWGAQYARYALKLKGEHPREAARTMYFSRLETPVDLLVEPRQGEVMHAWDEVEGYLAYDLASITLVVPDTLDPRDAHLVMHQMGQRLEQCGWAMVECVQGYTTNQNPGMTWLRFEQGSPRDVVPRQVILADHGPALWLEMVRHHTRQRHADTTACVYSGELGLIPPGVFAPVLTGYTDLVHHAKESSHV